VGSEGFSRFPSPHSLVSVGSDGFVFKSIVPTVTGELGFPKRELLRPFGPYMSCTHWYQSLRRMSLGRRYTLRQLLVGWRRMNEKYVRSKRPS